MRTSFCRPLQSSLALRASLRSAARKARGARRRLYWSDLRPAQLFLGSCGFLPVFGNGSWHLLIQPFFQEQGIKALGLPKSVADIPQHVMSGSVVILRAEMNEAPQRNILLRGSHKNRGNACRPWQHRMFRPLGDSLANRAGAHFLPGSLGSCGTDSWATMKATVTNPY